MLRSIGHQQRSRLFALLLDTALQNDLKGPLSYLSSVTGPIDLQIHALYNPEANTQYNIVPGLMGVVLTMTTVMITALAITRELESALWKTPIHATRLSRCWWARYSYILVGYIQLLSSLRQPIFFFTSNGWKLSPSARGRLCVYNRKSSDGHHLFHIAKNQRQAIQMAFFFFLPSILLSGFMFPFRGMPQWAQMIGELLPSHIF